MVEPEQAELPPDFHDRLALLQQECAVALAAFNQCSALTQRELVTAHGTAENRLDNLQRFVALTQKENEAYGRYLEARHRIFVHLKQAFDHSGRKSRARQAP